MSFATSFIAFWSSFKPFMFYSWPFLLLIGLWITRVRWRKYPIEAIIFEKKGENLVKTNDRVGKFFDTYEGMTFYKLKKCKDTLPVYNYDWVLHNQFVPTNLLEKFVSMLQGNSGTIVLFRYGSKQYKPVNPTVDNNYSRTKFVQINDDKAEPIFAYQYVQIDPRNHIGLIDFEVIDWDNMNFMVQEQRASIARRVKKGEFWKQTLIPLAIIAGAVMVSLFIMKFSFDAAQDLRGMRPADPAPTEALEGSKVGGAIDGIIKPGE